MTVKGGQLGAKGREINQLVHMAQQVIFRNVIFQSEPVEKLLLRFDLPHHSAIFHFNISIE